MTSLPGAAPAVKLHLGCGEVRLPGWVNVDRRPSKAVDVVADLQAGLPLRSADFIFAEHFIEHLDLAGGLRLLRACRSALRESGVLRLSTPNLDYVWAGSYASRWSATSPTTATIDVATWDDGAESARECLVLNRAFRGWGHRFLYNRALLEAALARAGFGRVDFCAYGESEHPELQDLERHERYPDPPALPHVLVAEASGRREDGLSSLEDEIAEYERDVAIT